MDRGVGVVAVRGVGVAVGVAVGLGLGRDEVPPARRAAASAEHPVRGGHQGPLRRVLHDAAAPVVGGQRRQQVLELLEGGAEDAGVGVGRVGLQIRAVEGVDAGLHLHRQPHARASSPTARGVAAHDEALPLRAEARRDGQPVGHLDLAEASSPEGRAGLPCAAGVEQAGAGAVGRGPARRADQQIGEAVAVDVPAARRRLAELGPCLVRLSFEEGGGVQAG